MIIGNVDNSGSSGNYVSSVSEVTVKSNVHVTTGGTQIIYGDQKKKSL